MNYSTFEHGEECPPGICPICCCKVHGNPWKVTYGESIEEVYATLYEARIRAVQVQGKVSKVN